MLIYLSFRTALNTVCISIVFRPFYCLVSSAAIRAVRVFICSVCFKIPAGEMVEPSVASSIIWPPIP
jgi:hypothetical protein